MKVAEQTRNRRLIYNVVPPTGKRPCRTVPSDVEKRTSLHGAQEGIVVAIVAVGSARDSERAKVGHRDVNGGSHLWYTATYTRPLFSGRAAAAKYSDRAI